MDFMRLVFASILLSGGVGRTVEDSLFSAVPRQTYGDSCGYAVAAGLLDLLSEPESGLAYGEEELRAAFRPEGGPLSLADLAALLTEHGLPSRPVTADFAAVRTAMRSSYPLVLLLSRPSPHYVLALGEFGERLAIGDPASGTVAVAPDYLADRYSGFGIVPRIDSENTIARYRIRADDLQKITAKMSETLELISNFSANPGEGTEINPSTGDLELFFQFSPAAEGSNLEAGFRAFMPSQSGLALRLEATSRPFMALNPEYAFHPRDDLEFRLGIEASTDFAPASASFALRGAVSSLRPPAVYSTSLEAAAALRAGALTFAARLDGAVLYALFDGLALEVSAGIEAGHNQGSPPKLEARAGGGLYLPLGRSLVNLEAALSQTRRGQTLSLCAGLLL